MAFFSKMNLMILLNLICGSMFLIIYRSISFIKNYTISGKIITVQIKHNSYQYGVFYFHDA